MAKVDRLRKSLQTRLDPYQLKPHQWVGVIGNAAGEVYPDSSDRRFIWVRDFGGVPHTVFNQRVPAIAGYLVKVGRNQDRPTLEEVVGWIPMWDAPSVQSSVPMHGEMHAFPSHDTVWVHGEQFTPWMAVPSGMTLTIYPSATSTPTGWMWGSPTPIDLSSYVPDEDALLVLISVDENGEFVVTVGETQILEGISVEDIPAVPAGTQPLWAVKLVADMTTIEGMEGERYKYVIDLRWGQGGGGDVISPATNTDSKIPQWNGANSKTLKDGLTLVTTVGDPGADTAVASEQAVREVIDVHEHLTFSPDTNEIYRNNSCNASNFAGTIATLPGGAAITYTLVTGNDDAMVCASTTNNAKMRLHNTTRGNYARIISCVVATTTITFDANVPANWQIGDVITILSPTLGFSAVSWVELEITTGALLNKNNCILTLLFKDTGTAPIQFRSQPYEGATPTKMHSWWTQVANQYIGSEFHLKITSNVICIGWAATGAGTATVILKQIGYYLP